MLVLGDVKFMHFSSYMNLLIAMISTCCAVWYSWQPEISFEISSSKRITHALVFQGNAMLVVGDVKNVYFSSDMNLLIARISTSYQLCPERHKAYFTVTHHFSRAFMLQLNAFQSRHSQIQISISIYLICHPADGTSIWKFRQPLPFSTIVQYQESYHRD